MIIQHNMRSLNADRQLGLVTGGLAKSAEKLSSGYEINRSADDAAGLSISEKMRKQIRGLNRATENIEDGISLCQVADGALQETVDILQRMRELAIQSANGTNEESDRQCIEMEIAQLRCEIDRIAQTTKFNEVVYPLNAPIVYVGITVTTFPEAPDVPDVPDVPNVPDVPDVPNVPVTPPVYDPDKGIIREKTITFTTTKACTCDGKIYTPGDKITVTGLTTNDTEVWFNGGGVYATGTVGTFSRNMGTLKKSDLKVDNDGYIYYTDLSGAKMYAFYSFRTTPNKPEQNPDPIHFETKDQAYPKINAGTQRFMTVDDLSDKKPDPSKPDPPKPNSPKPNPSKPSTPPHIVNYYYSRSGELVIIHSGDSAQQSNKIRIYTVNATCKGLEITGVTVATEDSSTEALDLLDNAIIKASTYRSAFGAAQNRLEHAKKINDNTSENTQASESKIRDTDMAAEMVKYSNADILAQAGQAMLAQANQNNQDVLSLIA